MMKCCMYENGNALEMPGASQAMEGGSGHTRGPGGLALRPASHADSSLADQKSILPF